MNTTANDLPRYVTEALAPGRYVVKDRQARRPYCPVLSGGLTRAQAELYAERLNSATELRQT